MRRVAGRCGARCFMLRDKASDAAPPATRQAGFSGKAGRLMWQRFLDRFVPLMDDVPSRLDLLDGVGAIPASSQAASQVGPADATSGVPSAH